MPNEIMNVRGLVGEEMLIVSLSSRGKDFVFYCLSFIYNNGIPICVKEFPVEIV